jgi:hypothetical protein
MRKRQTQGRIKKNKLVLIFDVRSTALNKLCKSKIPLKVVLSSVRANRVYIFNQKQKLFKLQNT